MALPGEARSVTKCEDCGEKMSIEVHRSPAGYYIGQWCSKCGPYNRLSGYYTKHSEAEQALKEGNYGR